jgi:hypothetical protein
MRHVLVVVAVVLAAALVCAPLASAQTKWVRGTVVSVGADTLTVKAAGKEMTFKVNTSTELTARGAGTAQREAERVGAAGVKFAGFVKPGMGVEVHYTDAAGVLTATDIHSGLAPSEGATGPEASGGSVRGTITVVSSASITVKGADKERTFTVDPKTTVVGTGLGTINRQFKEKGQLPTIMDLLGPNDKVVVYFKEAGATVRASEIRVTAKAAK